MINIDFYLGISLVFSLFLVFIFSFLFFGKKEEKEHFSLDERFIWFCQICGYTYINTRQENFSLCPRCESLNKKDEQK